MLSPRDELWKRWDDLRAQVMFVLACVFLAVLAGVLHRHGQVTPEDLDGFFSPDFLTHIFSWDAQNLSRLEVQLYFSGFLVLWPIFIVEAVTRFVFRARTARFGPALAFAAAVCLIPPLRIAGGRRGERTPHRWLPKIGWRPIDKELRKTLERFFSVPMIGMALAVLPLLVLQLYHDHRQEQLGFLTSPGAALFLDIGNAVVWFAFAFEFIVMVSVADKKVRYCVTHWLDMAIVLLPVIEFLPALRILRLTQLGRMGRMYRAKGLTMKAWRAFLLLDLVRRLTGNSLAKRLIRLKELLAAKEEECVDLRKEIERIKDQIAEKDPKTTSEAAKNFPQSVAKSG